MVKRIRRDQCCGIIVDVQEFFLAQLDKRLRPKIEANTRNLATLLGYFRIPLVVTLERPVRHKGRLPRRVANGLPDTAASFEKDFFDLTKEDAIRSHLKGLKKKQAIVAGCETDVCVLQSCLGLLELGYQVFLVEELLFSSAANVDAAIARLKSEGAVFVSYKTVFYELFEAVETGDDELVAQFGPVPDLPDAAV
jgi:nicotinamidase-related amidase